MDPRAVEQARLRYERAARAAALLDDWDDKRLMQEGWSTFLGAASGIYSKLEQGAKVSGKSQAWFGRVKGLRKTDDLLQYIHQARNADEHGIATISVPKAPTIVPVTGCSVDDTGNLSGTVGVYMEAKMLPPGVHLLTVTNYGVIYHPPKMHLGAQLSDFILAVDVARMALTYLKSLIDEAESYTD